MTKLYRSILRIVFTRKGDLIKVPTKTLLSHSWKRIISWKLFKNLMKQFSIKEILLAGLFFKITSNANTSVVRTWFLLPYNFNKGLASQDSRGPIACHQVDCTALFCNKCSALWYSSYSAVKHKKLPHFVITLARLCNKSNAQLIFSKFANKNIL